MNRYRNGQQFLSTSSSHHLLDSHSKIADSFVRSPPRHSSQKRRPRSSSMERSRRKDEPFGQHLGQGRGHYQGYFNEKGQWPGSNSLSRLQHKEKSYKHHQHHTNGTAKRLGFDPSYDKKLHSSLKKKHRRPQQNDSPCSADKRRCEKHSRSKSSHKKQVAVQLEANPLPERDFVVRPPSTERPTTYETVHNGQ